MTNTPPFRNRTRFYANSSSSTSTPCPSTRGSPLTSIFLSPFTISSFSPFRSPSSKLASPFGGILQFKSEPDVLRKPQRSGYGRLWFRHSLKARVVLFLVALLGILLWRSRAWTEDLNLVRIGVGQFKLGSQLFEVNLTKDLQFFPAESLNIHVRYLGTAGINELINCSTSGDGRQRLIGYGKMEHFLVYIMDRWTYIYMLT